MRELLAPDVVRFWVEAPPIARKRRPGQFVIIRLGAVVVLSFGAEQRTVPVPLPRGNWRKAFSSSSDDALPARGKIVGGYVNMAFQKSEAELNGYDEAVVLTASGHVNESSAANIFVVRDGVAITPPVSDDLLEGVTRKAIIELLGNEGIPVETRSIDRSELYVADEMLLCGTGVQISPVSSPCR